MTIVNHNNSPFRRIMGRTMPLALAAGLLTGCMQPTPYQPRLQGQDTGYTDRALTQIGRAHV